MSIIDYQAVALILCSDLEMLATGHRHQRGAFLGRVGLVAVYANTMATFLALRAQSSGRERGHRGLTSVWPSAPRSTHSLTALTRNI